ncbi:hypothetical protein PI126_g6310 [Phytophthora idaei]|nr:hypothetical protein PI126_g6310 [Phytophthora idaei]
MCFGGPTASCGSSQRTQSWSKELPAALTAFIKKKFCRREQNARRRIWRDQSAAGSPALRGRHDILNSNTQHSYPSLCCSQSSLTRSATDDTVADFPLNDAFAVLLQHQILDEARTTPVLAGKILPIIDAECAAPVPPFLRLTTRAPLWWVISSRGVELSTDTKAMIMPHSPTRVPALHAPGTPSEGARLRQLHHTDVTTALGALRLTSALARAPIRAPHGAERRIGRPRYYQEEPRKGERNRRPGNRSGGRYHGANRSGNGRGRLASQPASCQTRPMFPRRLPARRVLILQHLVRGSSQATITTMATTKMTHHFLGNSGLLVSKLSLGAWMFFDKTDSRYTADNWYKMLTTTFKHGINFFDSAENYTDGYSEELTGLAIQRGIQNSVRTS